MIATLAPSGVLGLLVHLAPVLLAVVFAVWWAVRHAPEGWQDDNGFHYGPEPGRWEGTE